MGIDPKLLSYNTYNSIKSRLSSSDTELVAVSANLVDKIREVPPRSLGPIFDHPVKYSGEETTSKLDRIRAELDKRARKNQEWAYILPSLPANAWLLNYRCPGDISSLPVAYSYVVLTKKKCVIFVDGRKVPPELLTMWKGQGITVHDYGVGAVGAYIHVFAHNVVAGDEKTEPKVFAPQELSWGLAEACAPVGHYSGTRKNTTAYTQTPVEIIPCPVDAAKGIKNKTEIQGFRNAYLRDGRAMVRWFAWLEKRIVEEKKATGEWDAAQVLTRNRQREKLFA